MRTPSAGRAAALRDELDRFVGGDPGRSVAVAVLDGLELRAQVAADVPRPAGSLLKVLAAIALYRAGERGELDLDTTVQRGALGATAYPSVLEAFGANRELSLREVCAFSLITSDNPAAQHIRTLVGQQRISQVVGELGLTATSMPVGFADHELGVEGRRNVTTANGALRLMLEVERSPELAEVRRFLINNQRNQRIPARLDDGVPVMHKTGSLDGVAVDAGIIHAPSGRIAVAYLCDHQPDTVMTSVAIGDSTLKIVDLVAQLRLGGSLTRRPGSGHDDSPQS